MKEKNDAELVMRVLRGDKKSFEKIVERYEKPIFNLAYRMLNNYEDAQDITQSVFIKAFERLHTYDPSHKLFSWLYRIAVNECINHNDRRRRLEELNQDIPVEGSSPEDALTETEISDHLQRALEDLKFDYRVVLVLKHLSELSYKEISEILEIPVKTVKSRLFTGRQLLKNILLKQGFAL